MAEFRIDRVNNRDIDLLVVENIAKKPDFARLFMGDVADTPLQLVSLNLWQDDTPGKPDVTAVFQTAQGRLMLLLEDNVAKTVSENSQDRIENEGKRAVEEGLCDCYRCCLLGPQNYLDANVKELEGFPTVSYEAIREAIKGDAWGEFLLKRAIAERSIPFSAKKNRLILNFWDRYYRYVQDVFPDLSMYRYKEIIGFQTTTGRFSTKVQGVSIQHKCHEGIVDVMVKLKKWSYAWFEESMTPYLFKGMKIRPKGKDALIYTEVPAVYFSDSFDAQLSSLNIALEAVVEMQEFMKELDYGRMEQILEESSTDDR